MYIYNMMCVCVYIYIYIHIRNAIRAEIDVVLLNKRRNNKQQIHTTDRTHVVLLKEVSFVRQKRISENG